MSDMLPITSGQGCLRQTLVCCTSVSRIQTLLPLQLLRLTTHGFLTVGFGATYNLYYVTNGGRQIQWQVATSAPTGYSLATPMIDLDIVAGAAGAAGVSALMAYKIQSQSAVAPVFTTPTAGNAVPSGWSSTLGTPTVGQIVWYIFGRYNSAAVTVDGIAANTTAWGGLTAASVFQDIRSDNWNGSNPPDFSTPATWGTTGYYIRRDDGTVILNNVGARGTLQTGTAAVSGSTMTGAGGVINANGTFAMGNSTNNMSFDGTTLTINGPVVATANISANAVSNTQTWTTTLADVYGTSGFTSGYLDLTSWGAIPVVLMVDISGVLWWNSPSGTTVYSGCSADLTLQLQQGFSSVVNSTSQSVPVGSDGAPSFVGTHCVLYIPNASAAIISIRLALSLRGAAPGGLPPSTTLQCTFPNGGTATAIGLKR